MRRRRVGRRIAGKRVVSLSLTLCGSLLLTGSLVAILAQWLVGAMRRLELGLTPVALENHIVILGWTSRSAAILRALSPGRDELLAAA
jgi:hypothetical protein